jgi:hypothetical protein
MNKTFGFSLYLALFVGAFLLAGASAQAAIYYIAPNGSNSTAGTLDAPWAITALSRTDKFGPGDTVIVEDGTYTYSGSQDSMFITINKSGTASSPIVIKSQNKWRAVLDGNKLAHSIINLGAYVSYLTIDGFDIRNARWGGIWENNGAGGTTNEAAHHITISRNKIHDIGQRLEYSTFNGINAIFTGPGAHDFTIDSNLFYDIGRLNPETTGYIPTNDSDIAVSGPGSPPAGYRYWTDAVHNWTHDHVYYDYSYLYNNMYNNVIYNANHGWAIYTGGNNNDINNTFLGPPYQVQAGVIWVGTVNGGIIANNIFMDGGLDTAICFWDPVADLSNYTVRNNIYNTANLMGAEFGGPGLVPFDFSSLNQSGNSAPNTDPGLIGNGKPYETIDQVGYDGRHYNVFHVSPANVNPMPASSASPTVNKAYRGDLPAVDYYGSSRPLPASSNGDIGAVELDE